MAKRGRQPGFYVYEFLDWDGNCLYVGKGSGRRLETQERRFGLKGRVVKAFKCQQAAYDYEAKVIQEKRPVHNRVNGGGGAIARKTRNVRLDPIYKEIRQKGIRVVILESLLSRDLTGFLSENKILELRQMLNKLRLVSICPA